MNKQVVHYVAGTATKIGNNAHLIPIDHPDTENVSNQHYVRTSQVVGWDQETGVIETLNTIYRPMERQ